MSSLICLPAHILDAHITPRAREVLMLLASQTSAQSPALWICQATIAERLRCSVATVARAIKTLIDAKLIAETGRLHEGRYKFYHVLWSLKENIKAASKKITRAVKKVAATKTASPAPRSTPRPIPTPKPIPKPIEGIQLILPPVKEIETPPAPPSAQPHSGLPPAAGLPPGAGPSTITPQTILKDSRIAYFAEVARKRHEENLRMHKAILAHLR